MKILTLIFILLLCLKATCQDRILITPGDELKKSEASSWKEVTSNRKGTVQILFFEVEPFIIHNSDGTISGIEIELIHKMFDFIEKKHNLDINVQYYHINDFADLYNRILNGKNGLFGIASFSITEKRKQEVRFSPPYMADIEVLICSNNIPIVSSLKEFKSVFSELTALNVANTTFDANLQNLKKKYLPNFKIEFEENSNNIRKRISREPNLFGYCELPTYLLTLRKGMKIKRQNLLKVNRDGYGFIFPKDGDWENPVHEFFNDSSFIPQMNQLIIKYLGDDVKDLLWKITEKETTEISRDVMLLTKEKEIQNLQILKNELLVNKQKSFIYFIAIILIFLIVILLLIYRNNILKQKVNKELASKNNQIQKAYEIIEQKNKDITDSIRYAKRIQNSILPTEQYIHDIFQEYFIIYKPKDVVSGDFYWIHKTKEDKIIWLVADCTGHGVPGAFMSIAGHALLNQIIIEKKIIEPPAILNELRNMIINTFHQSDDMEQSQDGMDIAICVLDKTKNILEYSGAHNSLLLLRKNILNDVDFNSNMGEKVIMFLNDMAEFESDKQAVGYDSSVPNPFSSKKINLKKGDLLYIFSDGFGDQFGGAKQKKFANKQLKQLLIALQHLSMNEQKNQMEKIIEEWKGENIQTDDICVWGVRII